MTTRAQPVRVVLADDHASYRQALDAVLSADSRLEVVGRAPDGRRALELIGELQPQVAVIDVMMAPLGGFDVCEQLQAEGGRSTRVILLSAYEDRDLVARGRACGAAGYLSKDASNDALCAAVVGVAGGRDFF
jgi:DNA-binding NarL/FixJ family response regulator